MTSQDIFYYSLSGGFLIFVGFFGYAAYQFAQTCKEARKVLAQFEKRLLDIELAREFIKSGALGLVNKFLLRRKGGR